jgi:hypothetical protein
MGDVNEREEERRERGRREHTIVSEKKERARAKS